MPNKNYLRGRKLEYDVVNFYKMLGYTAWRSAGSHGPADVMAVSGLPPASRLTTKLGKREVTLYTWEFRDTHDNVLYLIQCKTKQTLKNTKRRGMMCKLMLRRSSG